MGGFGTAVHEIELVLFTTLGPSGALAFALLVARAVLLGEAPGRRPIEKSLGVTLVVVIVGLVASATHLGTPSNALYVLTRVGASPLSNEMAALVFFLGLGATYWLYSFALRPRREVQGVLAALSCAAAVLFVASVGLAYSADTIVTWSTPGAMGSLWLTSLVGGPVLALNVEAVTLLASRSCSTGAGTVAISTWRTIMLLGASVVALLASVVSAAMQWESISGYANYMVTLRELVPHFWQMLITYLMLCSVGIVLCARLAIGWPGFCSRGLGVFAKADAHTGTLRTPDVPEKPVRMPDTPTDPMGAPDASAGALRMLVVRCTLHVTSSLLVFAGIFIMRFEFYMTHLTVGLGA